MSTNKFRSWALGSCFLIAAAPLMAQAQSDKPQRQEAWQTDWKAYVAELGKRLQKGVDPSDDATLRDKRVEFEGVLRKVLDPAKPEESLDVEMEPQQVVVMLKLFPGVDAEKAGNKTDTVTVRKVLVKPAESNRDAWKILTAGSKVRFRAIVGNDATVLVTMSGPGEEPHGLVFLFLQSAEVLPSK